MHAQTYQGQFQASEAFRGFFSAKEVAYLQIQPHIQVAIYSEMYTYTHSGAKTQILLRRENFLQPENIGRRCTKAEDDTTGITIHNLELYYQVSRAL